MSVVVSSYCAVCLPIYCGYTFSTTFLEVKYKTKTYAAKKYLCSTHTLSPVIGMIKIRHPNILPYYGIGKLSTDGSAVLVMRRIQINLTSFLQKEITLQRKVEILNDVANG